MIFRPLRYQHIEPILSHMKKAKLLFWQDARISISQDNARGTVAERKSFIALKKSLIDQSIQDSFIGPSKFKINYQNKSHILMELAALRAFLDTEETQMEDSLSGHD
ncbi:hypothetical protein NDU88_002915 [Pleurodeles waltl]|uniref:Uncharacterized protein n=1 Tax=Pleurodeles waltl TaxID=8319 RepID=A0AAV7P9P3_PLEWA|nr:hypothetical protein NDU88_002915 [Pleurodeles waltl]